MKKVGAPVKDGAVRGLRLSPAVACLALVLLSAGSMSTGCGRAPISTSVTDVLSETTGAGSTSSSSRPPTTTPHKAPPGASSSTGTTGPPPASTSSQTTSSAIQTTTTSATIQTTTTSTAIQTTTTDAGAGRTAAPAFSGTALDGSAVSLERYAGRPLVLIFWGST
jgi:hypothetical protein